MALRQISANLSLRQAFTAIQNNFAESYREVQTATVTYYVSTTGSDSNSGTSAGSPFLTIQKAFNVAIETVNRTNNVIIIQLADGTYSQAQINVENSMTCGHITTDIAIQGNQTTPGNVIVSGTSGNTFKFKGKGRFRIRWMDIRLADSTTDEIAHIKAEDTAIVYTGPMIFGAVGKVATQAHLYANNAVFLPGGAHTLSGSAYCHVRLENGAMMIITATPVISGTPAFTHTVLVNSGSVLHDWTSADWPAGATGSRYRVTGHGVIHEEGNSATHFAGNSAGQTAYGGFYQ